MVRDHETLLAFLRRARRAAFDVERDLGDPIAALQGPRPFLKRQVRKRGYRGAFRATTKLMRKLKLF
jgi:hypothetical protein